LGISILPVTREQQPDVDANQALAKRRALVENGAAVVDNFGEAPKETTTMKELASYDLGFPRADSFAVDRF
jgi:hypothetical protein